MLLHLGDVVMEGKAGRLEEIPVGPVVLLMADERPHLKEVRSGVTHFHMRRYGIQVAAATDLRQAATTMSSEALQEMSHQGQLAFYYLPMPGSSEAERESKADAVCRHAFLRPTKPMTDLREQILVQAAKGDGSIECIDDPEEFVLTTGGTQVIVENTPRARAACREILQTLKHDRLVESVRADGRIMRLTNRGFETASTFNN